MFEESAHRVILVHGTGAGALESDGDRWWQRGSSFWKDLDMRLRPGAACWPDNNDTPVFRWVKDGRKDLWKGPNLETERLKAGRDLLEHWLLPMERQGQLYHLVGHSHGGSVIWAALREAERRGEQLDHLRSWITIGTPFLHYRPNPFSFWDLAAFVLAGGVCAWFGWFTFRDFSLHRQVMLWHWLATLLLFSYLGYRIAVVLRAAWRVRADTRLARAAFDRYGDSWLGLYSPADEAMNGLRLSVGLRFQAVARIAKWPGWAAATWVPRVWPPFNYLGALGSYFWALLYHGVAGPFYNRWIAPEIDRFVSARLANKCHGNDRSGFVLARVTCGPLPDRTYQPILGDIDSRLRQKADAQAAALVRNLREELGIVSPDQPDLGQVLGIVEGRLRWTELVHTTYYDDPDVRDVLAMHIGWTPPDDVQPPPRRERLQALAHWRAGVRPQGEEVPAAGTPQYRGEVEHPVFEARLRRPYLSGLAFVLLPLFLFALDPRPWYLKLDQKQRERLAEKVMRSNHPLLQAVHRDDPDALEYFFTKGADKVAITYRRNNTLLGEAITYSKLKTVEFLVTQGFPKEVPAKNGWLPLHRAVYEESWDVIQLLFRLGEEIEERDDNGDTPLHVAAASGEYKIVRYLLKMEADPNAANSESKQTPLHAVGASGQEIDPLDKIKIAAALLTKGAQLEPRDRQGETPLHVAAQKGELELAKFLLQQGADPQAKDASGQTPADMAATAEIKNLLSGKRT